MMLKPLLLLFALVSGHAHDSYGAESYESGKPLTLAKALALTLEHSPELSAFSWDLRSAEARIIQAGLIPNPEIGIEGENLNELSSKTGNEMQNTLRLSQLIELGGKRKFRVREAQFDRESTQWDYQVERLEVLKQTGTAYIDVLAAQENVQLAEEGLAIAEAAVPAIQKRLEAGKASEVEMVRTNTAVATARIELEQVKRELQTARLNLAAQWGEKRPAFPAVMGNLEQVSKLPPLESLNAKLHRSPNIAKWTTEREKREATLNLVRAEAKPDLTFKAGPRVIQSHPVDVTFVAGFSIPLPLWNRNQGRIAEAESERSKGRR